MKAAGIGYPNGPADDPFYLAAPGPLLMLDSEARWHVDRFRAAGRPVVWRSLGTPPARLGWSTARIVESVLRHTGEQRTSLDGGLIFANEWNLSGERGDAEDDWADLERRYTFLSAQIAAVASLLRQRTQASLWYPAWSPHQHWREHVEQWAPSVDAVDVLAFHEYESLERIRDTYQWLRARWPDKPLACTEWNCRTGGTDELRRVLTWFAAVERDDPHFLGAYYFIGRWHPPADAWTDDLDLEGHPDRMALFGSPPQPEEVPVVSNRERYEPIARGAALAAGVDVDIFLRQITQESGWNPDAVSPAGATGIAQIVPRFHPTVNPHDPVASLEYAARLMAKHLANWRGRGYAHPTDYALALSSYNAGPVATAGGVAGTLAGWPYRETVRYVSVILQVTEREAAAMLVGDQLGQEVPVKLSEVLARGRSRIGDPYARGGKAPGGFDCSGFVRWCYDGRVTAFTDAVLGETVRVDGADIAPGDIVLWEYVDQGQPGVRFPHMGLYLSDGRTLDARFGYGVGERDQLPRSMARRYYRRLPGVVVDTHEGEAPPPPPPPPPVDDVAALRAEVAGLKSTLGYLTVDWPQAIEKEVADIRANLDAVEAALATLKGHTP